MGFLSYNKLNLAFSMAEKKVSIIIPAYNEEKIIKGTIEVFKKLPYSPKEIIIVVNNSADKTFEIAKKYADKALNFPGPIGVSAARNEGAGVAEGDVFLFSDADSRLSENAIEEIVRATTPSTLGCCLGRGDNESLRGKLFFFFKNWMHRLRIYKGVVDGILFCHRDIFFRTGGFNEAKRIAEFQDFTKRAFKNGGKYKLLRNCYAVISLRRYEEKGYIRIHLYWLRYKIASLFKKEKKIAREYFKKK